MAKEKAWAILVGIVATLSFAAMLYWNAPTVTAFCHFLDNAWYGIQLKTRYRTLDYRVPITIVAIDDKSLKEVGRFPWPRELMGKLVANLYEKGATTVALDFLFSEEEKGQDKEFAHALAKGNSILAFALTHQDSKQGVLPTPLWPADVSFLPKWKGFISSVPELANASKAAGAINAIPDADGVLRGAPIVLQYGDGLYPSLGLAAVLHYLRPKEVHPVAAQYQNGKGLEGLKIDGFTVPLTVEGTALIPFRGPAFSFPTLSAADVLEGSAPQDTIWGRLIFIGPTATGLGDFFPTAISPSFAGVEIHASLAASILDRYFPFRPTWGKGVAIVGMTLLGFIAAVLLPFFGPLSKSVVFGVLTFLLWGVDFLAFQKGFVLSITPIFFTLFILYIFNLLFGYFFQIEKEGQIKEIFGQYLPKEHLNQMLKSNNPLDLHGETKTLTVLFADIRNFTAYAETKSADEVKAFLNDYFTKVTKIILDYHGTVDKYEGDLVMAFWGAPLPDADHALHAVQAALAIQKIGFSLPMGIGINTGMMNVGDMGSAFRRAYTVIGDNVNFASRLQSLTKIYSLPILIGEETKEAIKGKISFRTVDKVQVKGKHQSSLIYEPLASADAEKIKIHEEAFQAYLAKDWDKAERLFQELQETIYLNRIAEYRKNPPPPGWDGTFTFQDK